MPNMKNTNKKSDHAGDSVLKKAEILLTEYLDPQTHASYMAFYADKTDAVIQRSVRELLAELVGEEQAKKIFRAHFGK